MIKTIAEYNVPAIIMHMRGTPRNMQQNPHYTDVVAEIKQYLQEQKEKANNAGITDIILDPGIGFGKTVEHNVEILSRFDEFTNLDCPLILGTSQKSFIGKLTNTIESERLPGTIASNVIGIMNGAHIVRVHDVKECKQAVQIIEAIRGANG